MNLYLSELCQSSAAVIYDPHPDYVFHARKNYEAKLWPVRSCILIYQDQITAV